MLFIINVHELCYVGKLAMYLSYVGQQENIWSGRGLDPRSGNGTRNDATRANTCWGWSLLRSDVKYRTLQSRTRVWLRGPGCSAWLWCCCCCSCCCCCCCRSSFWNDRPLQVRLVSDPKSSVLREDEKKKSAQCCEKTGELFTLEKQIEKFDTQTAERREL